MKRTPIRRKGRRKLSEEEQKARHYFRASIYGLPCIVCQGYRPYWEMDPHHVVERQELEARGKDVWDVRDAMPLCRDCHMNHHSAAKRIPARLLSARNWEFAREVLGDYADDYVARYYA